MWSKLQRSCDVRYKPFLLQMAKLTLIEMPFEREGHSSESLRFALLLAQSSHDDQQKIRVHMLMATGEGRFDFDNPNLNDLVGLSPVPFTEWLPTAVCTFLESSISRSP